MNDSTATKLLKCTGMAALSEVHCLACTERDLGAVQNISYISQLIAQNNFKDPVYPFPKKHAAVCYSYFTFKDTACDDTGNQTCASRFVQGLL